MTGVPDVWSSFAHDPRDPALAALRASDRDRAVVEGVLGEAYADGRLDRAELDERTESVARARTLGELPALISDLVALTPSPAPSRELTRLSHAELRTRAARAYESDRREALLGFLVPSLITLTIWLVINAGHYTDAFFWPGFVIAATMVNLLRTLVRRQDIIEGKVRSLEKKQLKERTKELGPGTGDESDS